MDDIKGQGTHWVCYRNLEKNLVEYFDPFGLIMTYEIHDYLLTSGKKNYSQDEIQNRETVLCGYWCLYYLNERQKVISNGIDKIWAADLVEMQKFSRWNKGIKYLLMVIDVFSKYGWIAPLKDKKTESVSKALNEIFKKSKRKPSMLWTDKGSEFISKHFKEFLKKEKIELYHTENEEKSTVVERWNRTMKNRMWKMFTENNKTVYWDKIDKLVDKYNNTKHSSVKMTPNEASKNENEEKVFVNL